MSGEPHTIPDHIAARIDRLVNEAEDMRRQASDDLKQIYADLREELRGMGWAGSVVSAEIAAIKGAIQEMRLDDKEKAKREEIDERRGDYVSLLTRARARERVPVEAVRGILSQSYAEAKGREKVTVAHLLGTTPSELTDTQEQPETDEPCDCSERVKPGEYYHCPKCDTEWFPEEDNSPSPETPQATADDEAAQANPTSSAPISNPQPTSSPGADEAGGVPTPPSPAALSDAEIPAFLRKEEKKDCLKLKDGHCKISFDTPALCSVCNAERMKARAA